MAGLFDNVYNPDVLSCLANLSSDEVFTPPEVANKMLDMLPQELFSNPDTKFLDPACKSGVFLREIVKLMEIFVISWFVILGKTGNVFIVALVRLLMTVRMN